ncbi:MAG: YpdA family putative bacillithiol disulfide reductase [Acidobacteriia bacterium]|nr:YpdA family putative bacillithiol disulfide reductase [Terriglobia bacterium]
MRGSPHRLSHDVNPITVPEAKNERFDLLVIGAGPSGLASAIETQRAGFRAVLIDKGCLVNSLFHYPANMTFFTTPELLEIGDIPFPSAHVKPTREEALEYYRKVAEHYQLDIRQYERVDQVSGSDGDFLVHTSTVEADILGALEGPAKRHLPGRRAEYRARKLVVATGYYDLPNIMQVPGEDLPKVFHYYREPHPFFGRDVLVIGGKNSAAIAALELWRHGARVTLVHRYESMHRHVKYWIKPDIENRIKNGEVTACFSSTVKEIRPESVLLQTPNGEVRLKNDFVFALTGYHPDYSFLQSLGIQLTPDECRPIVNQETLETNVPGIYVAGVIVAGSKTNEIFIENGRFHGQRIAQDLKKKLSAVGS